MAVGAVGGKEGTVGEGVASDTSPEAEELAWLLMALRRASVRAVRVREDLPALPEAQVALLRLLGRTGPLPPARVAEELDLARSTVSNLARALIESGLVERLPSDADGRSAVLAATARGSEVLSTFRAGRARALERALRLLPEADHGRVRAALPSLARLLEELRGEATDDNRPSHRGGRP